MERFRQRWKLWTALGAAALVLIVLAAVKVHDAVLDARMVRALPEDTLTHPQMIARAEVLAPPAYAKHCASCHGAHMQGDPAKGAANLSDDVWLYGSGRVTDIERTILYGIRSHQAKSRNITDMPAMGRSQQISASEARDVEAYILSLTRPEPDQAAVARGSIIYQRKGNCYDCHSGDARGNPDYGTPAFTDTDWLWGGDPATVYTSIYDGRHGVCPAWIGKLRPAVIRALAIYLHEVSEKARAAASKAHG